MILLGSIDIDDLALELVWSTLTDTVLADFCEVEPRRIGTAVIGGQAELRFVAQPEHLHWLGYENREARILQAAVRLFHDRPEL